MKISLVQQDYHIGNFTQNTQTILEGIKESRKKDADLIIFSELSISGYPPLDLLERKDFIENCIAEIEKIAQVCHNFGVIVGGPAHNPDPAGKLLFNAAYFLTEGKIRDIFYKTLLPTYDIFDEYRYFQPNSSFRLLQFRDKKIALTICEDLWDDQPVESEFSRSRLYTTSPMEKLATLHPDLIVNISASPYSHTRIGVKKDIFIDKAKKYRLPVVMVNQTGAQTELIFEGGSLAINSSGEIVSQLNYFEPDNCTIDFDKLLSPSKAVLPEEPDRIQMIHDALITGIQGYFTKMGFAKAVLGLSGGIDSAVTLALAVTALGKKNVHSILMPSQYSSAHSVDDSVEMCKNLDSPYDIIGIKDIFENFIKSLNPVFHKLPENTTEENIQSRIRAILLMAFSNKHGHILLNTSNKSEAAVGYGTLYGDMAGGLSVLGDVYKTDVYKLARYINQRKKIIPENIIVKPPSAELKPDQKDSDSLPDYDILDDILFQYIERQKPADEIKDHKKEMVAEVIRKVNINEYKRYQTPPILRISSKAFGYGRRIPLVAKY